MNDFLHNTVFGGVAISLCTYFLGIWIQKKCKMGILNPLLISIIFTIAFLVVGHVDYDSYYEGAKYISYLLTPATICLAIPLYEQFEVLKKNWRAVLIGIVSGVFTSLISVLGISFLFHFSHEEYVTFLPKSITTAIGMGVSDELGGYVSITVAAIIITGILGNICSDFILKCFHIKEPVAKGIAIGVSSHAVGTARAMEMGKIEGALSSLSIVVAGIFTVVGASFFAMIW